MMLTVKEVAEHLRVSRTCVYQLVEQGKLACHRIGIGRGAIRIAPEDLAAFVDGCRREERPDRPASSSTKGQGRRFRHLRIGGLPD